MLPATEDKEDLASTQWVVQLDDVLQLLQEKQQIVVTTNAVREDGGATFFPEGGGAQVEDVQPQVRQFNWSPNQAIMMVLPVWVGWREIMAVFDTAA